MAPRPTWQGHLRLSLVTCPVALYTATSPRGDVHFNMLHKTTNNRIRMIPTDPETGPVDRADIVKGYEVDKGRYVIVSQDEINSVRLESTRTIDIDRFVDVDDIDRIYWNDPYFMAPDGKMAAEAFTVIREAMAKQNRIALARVVLHQRERLLAIEPRGKGMLAYSLRTYDEVRDPAEIFDSIPEVKADPQMIEIASKIIEQQHGDFDPTRLQGPLRGRPEGADSRQGEGPRRGGGRGAAGHQRGRPDGGAAAQPRRRRQGRGRAPPRRVQTTPRGSKKQQNRRGPPPPRSGPDPRACGCHIPDAAMRAWGVSAVQCMTTT
ncbi:MAG: Ku protein [Caulobacteraceae bacterium]